MELRTYQSATAFLQDARTSLLAREVANSLMLGICLRLEGAASLVEPAPYFAAVTDGDTLLSAAVMTPPHNLIVHSDQPQPDPALVPIARDLSTESWDVPGVLGPSAVARAFAEVWAKVTGERYAVGSQQRLYELRQVRPPRGVSGRLRPAAPEDVERVALWTEGFEREALGGGDGEGARATAERRITAGDVYLWEDGNPVSMAARTRPMPHGVAVSLVYTPPEHRRHGYASACVAALSQLLLDAGFQFCTLFADLSNRTSNYIYQEIGYQPVCDFAEFKFSRDTTASAPL
jgi:predicted GNAT family acetyltransferase